MADSELGATKKKISDLLVKELKTELEKRGLDNAGAKKALLERLTKAIQDEGKNPDEFLFEMSQDSSRTPSKTPVKRSSRKSKTKEEGVEAAPDESINEDEEEEEKQEEVDANKKEINKEDTVKKNSADKEDEDQNQCNGSDIEVVAQHSPPKPETVPVIAPLTVEDVLTLDTSLKTKASDNDSLIVNVDDTQSDIDSSSVNEKESTHEDQDQNKEKMDITPDKETPDVAGNKANETGKLSTSETKEVETEKNVKDSSSVAKSGEESASETSESTPAIVKPKSPTPVKKEQPEKPEEKIKRVAASSKNLWISGLSTDAKAAELKALFSKHGKVIGAKIVTNAKTPSARYGFVTMATSKDAGNCIQHLHKTELQGRILNVERTTREPLGAMKRADPQTLQAKMMAAKKAAPSETKAPTTTPEETEGEKEKDKEEKKTEETAAAPTTEETAESDKKPDSEEKPEEDADGKKTKKRTPSKERELRSRAQRRRMRRSRSRSGSRERYYRMQPYRGFFRRGFGSHYVARRPFISTRDFSEHFDRDRYREREREPSRRYSSDAYRQSDIERKNREESMRLEKEKKRLRFEREQLERERAEVLKLEREKTEMERKKLEREKAELRKRTVTLEERRPSKRSFEGDDYFDDRKRPAASHRDGGHDEPSSRDRGSFSERRGDRFEGRPKSGETSPSFNSSGRREGRHEHEERSTFHRGGRDNRDSDRGPREDWKGGKPRDRNFDNRSGRNFNNNNESRGRNFDRVHPWEGGPPQREPEKFGEPPQMPGSQWAPVGKGVAWPPPQERWGAMDHPRGQPNMNMGHPPNIGPPPNQIGMFGGAGGEIINPMAGNFPGDRFNLNMVRRF